MPFKLLIQGEYNPENVVPAANQEWEGEVIIGRGEDSGFCLPDRRKLISSRHAKISRQGNDYVLIDVGSTNGTTLNGTRIQVGTPFPLAPQDQIGIGGYMLEFVPVDASNRIGEEDTDATLCMVPMESPSSTIVERLKRRYAELLSVPADEREAELVKILQETISGLKKEKGEEILSMVEQAFSEEDAPGEPSQHREFLHPAEVSEAAASLKTGQASANKPPMLGPSSMGGREDQVLTLLLDFVLDSINGRRQFEKELEVEVTRIFGKERNPIKWAKTSQEIRTYLFESPEAKSQFPQVRDELQLVLEDLALHPLGLMAGFRECLRFFLKQLDPLTLEVESKHKKKDLGSLLQSFGMLVSHPTWEHFKEKHRQLREEEIKTFHRLLGPEFAKGYLRVFQQKKLRENRVLQFLVVILCGFLVSCGGGSTKMDFGISLDASNRCNFSEIGQAVPVTVRIYTLQDPTRFEKATFQELWKTDYEYLGKDLLHRKELTLRPSSMEPIVLNVDPEANEKFIGIMVLFREYKDGIWRRVIPIEKPGMLSFGPPRYIFKCDQNVLGEAVKD